MYTRNRFGFTSGALAASMLFLCVVIAVAGYVLPVAKINLDKYIAWHARSEAQEAATAIRVRHEKAVRLGLTGERALSMITFHNDLTGASRKTYVRKEVDSDGKVNRHIYWTVSPGTFVASAVSDYKVTYVIDESKAERPTVEFGFDAATIDGETGTAPLRDLVNGYWGIYLTKVTIRMSQSDFDNYKE